MAITESGPRQYELVEGWGQLPDGWVWGQVCAVATDSHDNVHVLSRSDHPYAVFDKSGKLLDSWGRGLFERLHGICVTPDDTMYFVDDRGHIVTKWSKEGRHRLTLGTRGQPSDTGWTKEIRDETRMLPSGTHATPTKSGVGHRGPPFHRPTDIAVAANGDMFVSDGYRNAAVHRFSKDGSLLKSWGEPGNADELSNTTKGPGKFMTPHGIWEHKGKVYVCDRENFRVQIFEIDGNHVVTWPGCERPTKIYVNPRDEVLYMSELEDRFSVMDLEGNVLYRRASERSNDPGKFHGPHGIWADSEDSVYVGEVLGGARLQKFARKK